MPACSPLCALLHFFSLSRLSGADVCVFVSAHSPDKRFAAFVRVRRIKIINLGWHRQRFFVRGHGRWVVDAAAAPMPSYPETSKSLKPSAALVASLVSIYGGYNSRLAVADKSLTPQWADDIQAAEVAAAISCSGHGNVFVDSLAVSADGTPACECNDCFTGSVCSVSVVDCVADADSGNPLLFEPYWRENADLGAAVIPGWYRMGYLAQEGSRGASPKFYTDALIAAIRGLHATVGNVVTENRYTVVGTGSVQLINAVVHSLALQNAGRVSRLWLPNLPSSG